ncbi:hypothetical protein Tcan_15922 [Toxocara canis]|nr:hypothetical protein Tcan_15922 [Toxocara canis]
MFNDRDKGVPLGEAETAAVTDNSKPEVNGVISPLTAKRLKEDCSNVTTVVLDDLIEASDGTHQPCYAQVPVEQRPIERANVDDTKRSSKESPKTNEKRMERYQESSISDTASAAYAVNEQHQNISSRNVKSLAAQNDDVMSWKRTDNASDMEDITEILFETPSSQTHLHNASAKLPPQKLLKVGTQPQDVATETVAAQSAQNNYAEAFMANVCAVTGIDSSEDESDTDDELETDRRRNSNIAYVELNPVELDERLQQRIVAQKATTFRNSLDSEDENSTISDSNRRFAINPLQKSTAVMHINQTVNLDDGLDDDTDRATNSLGKSEIVDADFASGQSQQLRSANTTEKHDAEKNGYLLNGKVQEGKSTTPLHRPTRMYAISSSSSEEEDVIEKNDNITRLSVKSNGDATIKSRTLNGEIVRVQLAAYTNEHRKFDDGQMFTDDEFSERLV